MRPSISNMPVVRALRSRLQSSSRPVQMVASCAFATCSLQVHRRLNRNDLTNRHIAPRRCYATPASPNEINSDTGVNHSLQQLSSSNTVATITVSNPKKLNIVNSTILDQLISTCKTISTDENLRAVVLTGGHTTKTPAFIGGADINEMHALSSPSDARSFITKVHEACQALRDIPVPVIAKIDGFCLGGGLEIAVACDLRIATERSSFAMPEVRVGIPSVAEAALLPGLIGMGRARRLLYLAETIGGVEAERWGLIEKVVSGPDELEKAVQGWLEATCEMGPRAMRSQKRLMLEWENQTAEEGIMAGVNAFADAYEDGGEEPKEYLGRFLRRRK